MLLQHHAGRSPSGADPSLTPDTDRCSSAALAAQVALAPFTERGADFCCSYAAAAAHLLRSQVAIYSRVFVSSKVSVIPSFNENCIKIRVVQPMNARSRRKITKRQWPPAEGAVSLSKTTLLLARRCQGQQLGRAEPAAARERLCVVVRAAPGRECRRVLPGACGSSCRRCVVGSVGTADGGAARCASPHGHSRPFVGDWRRHTAGRLAPPAPPVGAPRHGRPLPRATTACLCMPPAGECLSCLVLLDPRACVATGSDLPGHKMDYVVKERKTVPNGEKKPLCIQKCCSRQHTGPAARRGRSTRAPSGRHGVAPVRWDCESRPTHRRQQPCRPRAAAPQRSVRGAR